MSPEQWLEKVGSEYLARVKAEEPQFLVEIDIPDDRLEEIFNNISRAWPTRWTTEKRLCLALAAVHSAARADAGEDSFREVFYRRLQREFKQAEWENYYGSCIATFLKDWFSVELPDSGPYRYVGAIYRHAGIPVPARSSFCQLLGHLWKGGVAFTRDQYAEAVQKVSSTVARRFLESQAGYDFAQTTARFIVRWEHGQISAKELATFPSYRRSLYEAVLSEMQRTFSGQRTLISGSYPPPILALDPDARRLVVKFDAKGVAANVYRTTSGPVYYAKQAVSGSAPPRYLIRPETEWLTVTPWWVPGRSSAALFRVGDGGLVDMSRDVQAGTYYLVTSTPELVPPEIVLEEGSYLEHEEVDAAGAYYSILHVDLAPGYELPELSIHAKGSAAPPALEFSDTDPLRHSLGRDVFVARLPSLRVLNWTADCDNKYWLWINDGSGEKRLKPASDGSVIEISVPCPSQGTIWLEPKYYIRGSSALQQLTFAVIPRGIDIHVLEACCGIHEPAHLQVRLPSGWQFEPKTQLQSVRPDLWQISAGDRVIDATLSCGGLKFPISLLIPRVALWFNAQRGDGSVLWREDLSHDLLILVEGLPNTRCSILLEAEGSTRTICDLGILPASGTRRISLVYFRDALAACGFSVAEFMLRLGEHAIISTGRYFASGDAIERSLSCEPVESKLFRLPSIGDDLLRVRRLFDEAPASVSFSTTMDVPHSLRSFLCGLAYAAAEFDASSVDGALEQYKALAPDFLLFVLNWVNKANASLSSLGNEEELLATFPADDVAKLPVTRWREAVNQLLRHIRLNQNVPELVRKWRQAVEDSDREHESELLKRPGGRELTDAARRYHDSFFEQGKARNDVLTRSIIALRQVLNKPGLDPLIRVIASALLQLGYYRSDRLQDAAEISIPEFSLPFERLASSMRVLAAHCQGKPASSLSVRGLGFADLSTRSEDASLEIELGNSSRLTTSS